MIKVPRWKKGAFSGSGENRKKTFKILIEKTPKGSAPPYQPLTFEKEPEEQLTNTQQEQD